jgi:hypothetical protein
VSVIDSVLLTIVTLPDTGSHAGSVKLFLYCAWKFVPAAAGQLITGTPPGESPISHNNAGGLTVSAYIPLLPLKLLDKRSEAHERMKSVVLSPLNAGASERLFPAFPDNALMLTRELEPV